MGNRARAAEKAARMKFLNQRALSEGRNSITLREARKNVYLTTEQVADIAGIDERELEELEIDSTEAEIYLFNKLCSIYRVSISHVFAGREEDLLKARIEFYREEALQRVTR